MSAIPSDAAATSYFYRFRSMQALLGGPDGFDELRKQEIYFASPKDLNDPLEGYKNIFWRGDSIVWRNLLRHYILCLLQNVALAFVAGTEHPIEPEPNYVFSTENDLPTPEFRALYRSACQIYLLHQEIQDLPDLLATRHSPVKRNELSYHLRTTHLIALDAILSVLEDANLKPARAADDQMRAYARKPLQLKQIIERLNQLERENPHVNSAAEALCGAGNSSTDQLNLIAKYNGSVPKGGAFWRYILMDYPIRHVDLLEQLLYPDWYTACFVKEPMHSAMWSVYGDSHKGVCLKFRSQPNANGPQGINLLTRTSLSGGKGKNVYHSSDVIHAFHPVRYVQRFVEIDFFRSLGRLTKPALNHWYSDPEKGASPVSRDILAETDAWRKQYWENSLSAMTAKTPDWSYECEHRLVLQSVFDLTDRDSRKLKYNFSDLQGIIFGTKTTTANKLEIMKIIEEKCRQANRPNFEFFQAMYSAETGTLIAAPMSLVKFN